MDGKPAADFETRPPPDFLASGGEMGARMRAFDWAATAMGPPEGWPQALRTAIRLLLTTNHPVFVFWGADHVCFYNDAYRASLGPEKHPAMLGARGRVMWNEIWDIIGPQIDQVMAGEGATWHEDALVPIIRNGKLEDVYWTYGYSPIDHEGGVGGVLVLCTETTKRVLANRRRAAEVARLRDLVEEAPSFFAVLMGPGHRFEFVNESFRRLFAGGRDLIGRTVAEMFPETIAQGYAAALDQVLGTGESHVAQSAPFTLETGVEAPRRSFFDFMFKAIRNADGAVVGVLTQGHDVTDSVTASRALHESQERLVNALKAGQLGVHEYYSDGDQYVWDPFVRDLWGVEPGEAIDFRTFKEGVHPEDFARVQAAIAEAIDPTTSSGRYACDYRVVNRRTGDLRVVAANADVQFGADGARRMIGTIRDITDRRAAETALRESEARFRALADAMPQLVWTAGPDGVVDYYNARRTEYFGGEGRSLEWVPLIHKEDLAKTVALWREAMASGEPYFCEHRLRRADGGWRWHVSRAVAEKDAAGAIAKWYGTATDIAETIAARDVLARRESDLEAAVAERTVALQASEARLRTIFETTFLLQGLLDTGGKVLDVNAAALDAVGGARAALVGQLFWDSPFFSGTPGAPEAMKKAILQAARGERVAARAVSLSLPTGQRSFDLSLRPVRDADGAVVAIVPEALETTARLAAEEALRQAQKMEAVGQLTGGVAHDFNNLLMALSGGLDMLDRQTDPERRERIKAGMKQAVDRGAGLTRQLLAFSRRRPLEARAVDLNRQIASMEEMLERSLGGGVNVEAALAPDLWPIEIDPGELELAILNLCVNARDAMEGKGVIFIEAANETRGAPPVAGDAVRLAVRDTGAGMSRETLARVFEPFFTTKEVGKGSGLGLAQVYAFVTQSSGHVEIETSPGAGTLVSLVFPRAATSTLANPQEATAPAPRLSRSAKHRLVLLVEDDRAVAEMLTGMLDELGYAAGRAATPAQALEFLESGAAVDLVLSDVMMPGGTSGVELARAIAGRWPKLPVILVTGFIESARDAQTSGLTVLAKPFKIGALGAALAQALDRVDA